ncbi:uncharacterized protein V6R79_015424 [Siganus canaliculatus]
MCLQAEPLSYTVSNGRSCKMCPAGEYQKSCSECEPCPAGKFTLTENREDRCQRCSTDCRPEFHLKVVRNCTSTSDVECACEEGFVCNYIAPLSNRCRSCKIQETVTTADTTIPNKDKHTPSPTSSGHSSTSTNPCRFPKCGSPPDPVPTNGTHPSTDKASSQLVAILIPVVVIGSVVLMIFFFVWRPSDESCLKQAIATLLCNEGSKDASHKPKESTHHFPRDSFSAKQQPSSLSAANLGPVHVHNPGTVIFSLLSHFTGQVGPTLEGEKTLDRGGVEDDERDCPVFHPTSSPSIHLSEEERSAETDNIFFPSQEQGKDCHMSKEEAL